MTRRIAITEVTTGGTQAPQSVVLPETTTDYLRADGSFFDVQALIDAKQATSAKGAANGYAGLDATGLVPVAQLPGLPAAWGAITGVMSAQTDLQSAIDLKANLASPTFTGTVGGVTAAMVGLGSVNNTSDAAKPVSTAQQTALDAKQATLVSGTNIKTVNGSTLLGSGNLAVSASDPSYAPGSFTVATGTGRMIIKRMAMASTERSTIAGTARLRLT